MDIDEDDDLYVPEEPKVETTEEKKPKFDDLEEGEEEDEGAAMDEDDDDSVRTRCFERGFSLLTHSQDIDIITERKDGSKPAPPPYVNLLCDKADRTTRTLTFSFTTVNPSIAISAIFHNDQPLRMSP